MRLLNNFFLSKTVRRRYSTLELLFWSAFAAYYPMIVVYLRYRNFENTTIGLILAINSCMAVISQPFWGMVSDSIRSVRKVFVFCFTLAIITLMLLPLCKSAVLVTIAFAVITFFESGLVPLLDSWIVRGTEGVEGVHYGSVRLFGSIGFAISVLIVNMIIENTSINCIFPLFAIIGAMAIMWSFVAKDQRIAAHHNEEKLSLKPLLKNKDYVFFLIFSVFLFAPFRGAFFFLPNAMEAVGGGQREYGIAFSITALSEVPIFLFSGYLVKKYKPANILLFSSVFFIIRQIGYLLAQNPTHLMMVQATQGLTFGLFLTGTVYYVNQLAPNNLKSTAQSVVNAVYFGVGGVIGSYGGGWIIDNMGLKSLYTWGLVISIITTLFFLVTLIVDKPGKEI